MDRELIRKNVIKILKTCQGEVNAIMQDRLYCMATGDYIIPAKSNNQTRVIRSIVRELRDSKTLPILSGAKGYWLAVNEAEMEAYIVKQLRIAARKFKLARRLSHVPVSEIVAQYNFNFTDEESDHDTK